MEVSRKGLEKRSGRDIIVVLVPRLKPWFSQWLEALTF